MENTLKLFTQLTDAAFSTAAKYFDNNARKALVTRWQDYCANGTQRAFATGDIKHAQKMYSAAVICGFRLPFERAVVPQLPFLYNKNEGFTGKIQKGKRAALEALDPEGITTLWENNMRLAFDGENVDKPAAAFNLVKRLGAVIKKDRQQDTPHTDAEIRKELTALLKEFPAIREVEVQQVKEGQIKERNDKIRAAKAA